MDPRMRSLWIETFIFVIIPTIIFKLKIMVIEDIYNPMVDILLVIIVAELFRLLYKFRKLRLEGVDIDSEAGARPSSSSSDPKLNDVLSKQNRIVYLFEWVVGIFGICIALVAVIFIVLAFVDQNKVGNDFSQQNTATSYVHTENN